MFFEKIVGLSAIYYEDYEMGYNGLLVDEMVCLMCLICVSYFKK